jgi:type IV secretory pathway VirJ component
MLEPRSIADSGPHSVQRDASGEPPVDVVSRLDALHLPLEVFWPKGARAAVVFVSGDGGWADLDRGVAKGLAARGIAVVGWNTLRYFWKEKTPSVFAADLAHVVGALPADVSVFAGGYSFGAETIPVVVAAATDPALRRIVGLTLLAPGPYATFEVSPLDWLRGSEKPNEHPVAGAIDRAARPVLCLVPDTDRGSGCPPGGGAGYTRAAIPGGHHFGADYDVLAARVASFVKALDPR